MATAHSPSPVRTDTKTGVRLTSEPRFVLLASIATFIWSTEWRRLTSMACYYYSAASTSMGRISKRNVDENDVQLAAPYRQT